VLSHTITGNRGRYATVFDEDGRTILQLIDVDQTHAFEFVVAAVPGQVDPVRVEMPGILPSERGSWVIEADGSTVFNTPDEWVTSDYDEGYVFTGLSEVSDAVNLITVALNIITRQMKKAGILREDDVAILPTVAELVVSTDMNIFTPTPAEAGTETDLVADNGILAEARCICVDPTVVIA
jgi:hypothetical protein